ncbi:hypothetical protein IFM89_015312 [Coptis chinensis]|uniref:Uncharacterized protein n=1 Tax=Coptis chinensis TaxID=261450 RepID=A0A835IL08_9MAGN|nr:hypothetical protein IFM89_015312 [Coptis chinensis]
MEKFATLLKGFAEGTTIQSKQGFGAVDLERNTTEDGVGVDIARWKHHAPLFVQKVGYMTQLNGLSVRYYIKLLITCAWILYFKMPVVHYNY